MPRHKGNTNNSALIDLFLRANEIKTIPRTGWVREKVKDPESVAEHLFSLSFITMQLAPILSERLEYPLNIPKLIKMALLHDFGEIEVGDIVVYRGAKINIEQMKEKEKNERKAIKNLFAATDKSNLMLSFFDEFLERETLEAKILWQLDRFDFALQALSYELTQGIVLDEFFEHARANITDELLLELLDETLKRRPKT